MVDPEKPKSYFLWAAMAANALPSAMLGTPRYENTFEQMVRECQVLTGRSHRVSSAGMRRLLHLAMTRPISLSLLYGEWRQRTMLQRWGAIRRYGDVFFTKQGG
ncbi:MULTISPECIES: hypothetical protein [Agrobacterium]|uniref:hypothetical protein n=1 Tax=Agrobacterium TaxID=357 RepID=UPI000ABBABB3|nr:MULTISPECIES: hypothetical protein [Agrobacterium]